MSLHPTLQPYADAWTHSVDAISEMVQSLVDGEWNRRTPCPGWSVRDIVSHVIGMDCEMLGDPRPIHALPRDLFHVTTEHQRYMEMQVDVRRHHTAPEMTAELEYTVIRRNRQLRNESRDPGARCAARWARRSPWKRPTACGRSTCGCTNRTCVRPSAAPATSTRRALRRAGRAAGGAAPCRRQERRAPRSSAVVFDVHGPVEFLRTVRVDIQGRGTLETAPALGPAAALTLDWETYVRLACGRVTPESVADRVKTEGDQDLASAILRHFCVTP